uniref:Uncharacterized protein n=1 Tax=Ditylenchus dipsaci TaxID=166011 RepID=A0A915DVQ8_9BILA
MDAYSREPCPFRIADDIGVLSLWVSLAGQSFIRLELPETQRKYNRLLHGCCKKKGRRLQRYFSGAATGALLAVRSGPGVMVGSALLGGTILAMIEGVQVLMGKMLSQQYDMTQQMAPLDDPKSLPSKPSSSISSPSGKMQSM